MYKIFNSFLLTLFLSKVLMATEPTIAILTNILSNDIQEFQIKNYKFYCKPYGVFSLNELHKKSKSDSTCRKTIEDFYKKRQDLYNYSKSKLKILQSYPIQFKNNRCIISVNGEKSLAELLLQEGLAIKKPKLKDSEYEYYLFKAQYEAKITKKGIWIKNIEKECVASLYKK